MKKCKRLIYATLAAGLLTAALPTMAHAEAWDDPQAFGFFASIDTFFAKIWPFSTKQPDSGSTPAERVRVFGKIGIDIDVGGLALPPENDTNPPGSSGSPTTAGG